MVGHDCDGGGVMVCVMVGCECDGGGVSVECVGCDGGGVSVECVGLRVQCGVRIQPLHVLLRLVPF